MKKYNILMTFMVITLIVIIFPSLMFFLNDMLESGYIISTLMAFSICITFLVAAINIPHNSDKIVSGYKDDLEKKLVDVSDESNETINKDILQLMIENMGEIKEYYLISKNHIQLAFWLAFCSCIFGFILLSIGLYIALYIKDTEPAIFAIIGGTVTELVAGTSLLIHKSSIKQLNFYYKALHENEQFLSIINLVAKLSQEKQDGMYEEIIRSALEKYKNKE